MNIKDVITIEARRTAYSAKQAISSGRTTLTAQELIDILSDYEPDTPVIFSNDKGYTYGEIAYSDFDCIEVELD